MLDQIALRAHGVAAYEQQGPHFVVREIGLYGMDGGAHAPAVGVHQVVHGLKDVGRGLGSHGNVFMVDLINE
ncbi:hypothetical protein D3C86_2132550 [compost metagenome]